MLLVGEKEKRLMPQMLRYQAFQRMVPVVGLEPDMEWSKMLIFQCVFLVISIFISVFFPFLGIEIRHGGLISGDIALRDVGVDLVHGSRIGPAADLHGDLFRHLQVICQGGKAVPKPMHGHIRNLCPLAGLVDLHSQRVLVIVHNRTGRLTQALNGL